MCAKRHVREESNNQLIVDTEEIYIELADVSQAIPLAKRHRAKTEECARPSECITTSTNAHVNTGTRALNVQVSGCRL